MLVAAAISGMRGLPFRSIRIGSLFWPDKFAADRVLGMCGGWGIEAYSPADGTFWMTEVAVDEDGGFNGHTWLTTDEFEVVDLMHDNPGSPADVLDDDWKTVARYIRRPQIERRVKAFWRPQMTDAIKAGARTK